jgi:hypothetical protein
MHLRAGRWGAVAALLLVAADTPHPRGYVCHRADVLIKVDGMLDDPAWSRALWTDDFIDIEGDVKPRPRFRTRAKMLWDDRYLYVAAELEEPDVWGRLTAHDSVLFHDLDFEVFVDPDGDNHEYAELEINALGTTWDLFLSKPYRDAGKAADSFEFEGLKSAVHVAGSLNKPGDKDEGWTIEIAIPWSSFVKFAHSPIPPKDGDQWRVNFSRVEWRHRLRGGAYEPIPRTEDNWVWSPQGRIAMHMPERWGYVQFASGEPGSVAFRPDSTWPARGRLMQVYEAQQAFRAETGRYARSLGKMRIEPGEPEIVHRVTEDGFEASVGVPGDAGRPRTVTVSSDSKIRVTP